MVKAHDAHTERIESGIAFLDAQDPALGQVEGGLVAAEAIADSILDTLAGRGWEDVGEEGEEEIGVAGT